MFLKVEFRLQKMVRKIFRVCAAKIMQNEILQFQITSNLQISQFKDVISRIMYLPEVTYWKTSYNACHIVNKIIGGIKLPEG